MNEVIDKLMQVAKIIMERELKKHNFYVVVSDKPATLIIRNKTKDETDKIEQIKTELINKGYGYLFTMDEPDVYKLNDYIKKQFDLCNFLNKNNIYMELYLGRVIAQSFKQKKNTDKINYFLNSIKERIEIVINQIVSMDTFDDFKKIKNKLIFLPRNKYIGEQNDIY